MKIFNKPLTAAVILLLLLTAGCNYPGLIQTTPVGPEIVLTYAAQTIAARITLATIQLPATPDSTLPTTPAPAGPTPTLPPGVTPSPTPPLAASATPPADELCDRAGFVRDVTIPDDTRLDPGAPFTKTWLLKNTGTCAWDTNYAIVFDHGETLGAPASISLPSAVAPGQEVEVSANMTAPAALGIYQGFWRLRNAAGKTFGLGAKADKEFWVKIQVGVITGISYDFLVQAPEAVWTSGGGGTNEAVLDFDGQDSNPEGVAKLKKDVTLEHGKTAGVTLVTHPRHADNGTISGLFPEYKIEDGDHFIAKLGFLEDCGQAQVIFRFGYRIGDEVEILGEWRESCNGSLNSVDLDLSDLSGKKVQFIFAVLADGSPEGDMAVWGSARIER